MNFRISRGAFLKYACYGLLPVHFILLVVSDLVMGIEYYRGFSDHGKNGFQKSKLNVSLPLLIAMYCMVISGVLLYCTAAVLTWIGFRRRIRGLAMAYIIYLGVQLLTWFDMAVTGLEEDLNSFFWLGRNHDNANLRSNKQRSHKSSQY
ncbi:unnamed protein product, partial [Mesorhabditis spiculigera]